MNCDIYQTVVFGINYLNRIEVSAVHNDHYKLELPNGHIFEFHMYEFYMPWKNEWFGKLSHKIRSCKENETYN